MSGRTIAIVVAVLLVLCVVVAALGAVVYWYINVPTAEAAVEPTVLIDSPSQGDEVVVGQSVQIFATGQDPSGIARMELWVDGQFVVSRDSASAEGTNPFPFLATWEPTTPGNHTITVRGYNVADADGQASVSVNAVQGPDIPTEMPAEGCEGVPVRIHEVQEGETLEGIAAGYEVTVEDILACSPGVDPAVPLTPGQTLFVPYIVPPGEEGTGDDPPGSDVPPELPPEVEAPSTEEELPPPDEDPPPAEPPPDPAPDPPPPPADPPDPPPPPVALEFEALELETDQQYLAVYCLVQLEDAMERVPIDNDDFLDHVGPPDQNYWDIAAELSGANSRPVAVIPGDTVRVFADCYALIAGVLLPTGLGEFTRQHPEADWNGDPIEVWSDGGQFRVKYRICQGSCDPTPEINRPYDLQYNYDMVFGHYFTWSWDDDPTQPAEGFRLYREGVLLYEQPGRGLRFMQVYEEDVSPWCWQLWAFTLTAYEGVFGVGPESLHSDPEDLLGDACTKHVDVIFPPGGWEGLWTQCIPNDCPAPDPTCSNCEVEVWYGSIYANYMRIEREPPPLPEPLEPWIIMVDPNALIDSFHGFPGIFIADLFDNEDTMHVHLAADEDLTIGISLTDWDMFDADTLICEGAITKDAADLFDGGPAEGLGSMECRDEFNVLRGWLVYTIDVAP